MTWAEAVIDCAKRGMELALPRNRRQYERLKDKLGRNMNDEDVWIAATDFHHERIFSDLKGLLTLTRPIGLPPHAPVAQKIAAQR